MTPEHPDAVAEPPAAPAASGLHPTYDTYQAEVGDRVIYDGIEMVVFKVQRGVSTNASQHRGYKAGPLCWARRGFQGLAVVFDASMHDDHEILLLDSGEPQ